MAITQTAKINKAALPPSASEADVEQYAGTFLQSIKYHIRHRKTGNKDLDRHWPSKAATPTKPGAPDTLIYIDKDAATPFCVWESKSSFISVEDALDEAKFYIEGLHRNKPLTPGLPRLAAGFNGKHVKLAYLNYDFKWFPLKADGMEIADAFPLPNHIINGISSNGNFLAASGLATANDLRRILPALKTIYRSIPVLASGRRPIDFTVALLTMKMLIEMFPTWGTWAEQPALVAGALSKDEAINERFAALIGKVFKDSGLRKRYGDIFQFEEKYGSQKDEVSFSFEDCLKQIQANAGFFTSMFDVLDGLPPLHGADFDVFGEVYQSIGDDATKKALGEFFTGRHIISAVVPVLFGRAGVSSFEHNLKGRTIADIACGTGGFLTETLRYIRRRYSLTEEMTTDFAVKAFFGYDLSHANASRARVNMYFAGDGFSFIEGGIDSLSLSSLPRQPKQGFDFILANPPYGNSSLYGRIDESFLNKIIDLLTPGVGWGLVVLPTGVMENPRSADTRLHLLRNARITDVIALPKHAFAPYTAQRTAIIIFQRRESELAAQNWQEALQEVGNEKISLFVVDNDGFANSDKRYPTARQSATGEWLHDDLASWIDKKGHIRSGKLFDAALNGVAPKNLQNEFGEKLGKKHGVMSLKKMASYSAQQASEQGRGISLMPDSYLRSEFIPLTLPDFIERTNTIIKFLRGESVNLSSTFESEVKELLYSPIDWGGSGSQKKVRDIFDIKKGNQGLTEAVIYRNSAPTGCPVYGGGENLPRFKIVKGTKNEQGKKIDVHSGPALIVAMDGSSGSVRYIHSGEFCCNHHASVLKLKPGLKINLLAVAQQLEGGLRALASNKAGSATLTLPSLSDFVFDISSDKKTILTVSVRRKILSQSRDRFFGTR